MSSSEGEERSLAQRARQILFPLLVLGAGAGVFVALRATAPSTPRSEPDERPARVELASASSFEGDPIVEAQGRVYPRRRAELSPQVRAAVVETAPGLSHGGRFEEGEALLRLDRGDFLRQVTQRRAEVAEARVAVVRQRSEQAVAQQAWGQLETDPPALTEEGGDLSRHEPQLERARRGWQAARARLHQARVNLERTTLRAPFDGVVTSETVDVGQVVGPGAPVLSLVGTDRYEVRAAVPVEDLPHLLSGDRDHATRATLVRNIDGEAVEWSGWVARVLPAVEEQTALARVAVAVPDPLGLEREQGPRRVPLLLGSLVDVRLHAEPLEDVVRVPLAALRGGDHVWSVEGGELRRHDVDVAWTREASALVRGLNDGARVVVGPLVAPVEGMRVRESGS